VCEGRDPHLRGRQHRAPTHDRAGPRPEALGRLPAVASTGATAAEDGDRAEAPPTWACASEALGVCLYRPNRRRVAVIAGVVGSLLVAINQGGTLASGHLDWVVWVRVGLDYVIPACVSTMGVLAGSRRAAKTSQSGPVS
jgi:hypothetical protein